MHRFCLDTNVFSYIADGAAVTTRMARRLRTLLKARTVQILGSWALLGEFVPRAQHDSRGYRRMVDAFWNFCGTRILRPSNELILAEIKKGNRLSLRDSIIPEHVLGSLQDWSYDPQAHPEWTDDVKRRKKEYVESMSTAASGFEKTAEEKWGAEQIRQLAGELTITRDRIAEWGRDIIIRPEPSRYGLSEDESAWPDLSLLPCTSAFVAMTIAWCRK